MGLPTLEGKIDEAKTKLEADKKANQAEKDAYKVELNDRIVQLKKEISGARKQLKSFSDNPDMVKTQKELIKVLEGSLSDTQKALTNMEKPVQEKKVKTPKLSDSAPKVEPTPAQKMEPTPAPKAAEEVNLNDIKEEPDVIIPIDETVQPIQQEATPQVETPKATVTPPDTDFAKTGKKAKEDKMPPMTDLSK